MYVIPEDYHIMQTLKTFAVLPRAMRVTKAQLRKAEARLHLALMPHLIPCERRIDSFVRGTYDFRLRTRIGVLLVTSSFAKDDIWIGCEFVDIDAATAHFTGNPSTRFSPDTGKWNFLDSDNPDTLLAIFLRELEPLLVTDAQTQQPEQ